MDEFVYNSDRLLKGSSTFAAFASQASSNAEATEGKISLDQYRFRFQSTAVLIEIPLTRLQIEPDESDNSRVLFSDPTLPDWILYTLDRRILEDRWLRQLAHTRNQLRDLESYGELQRRLKVTLWCLVIFAVMGIGVWLATELLVRSLVARIPAQWERELGDTLLAEIKEHEAFLDDAKMMTRLLQAVGPLTNVIPNPSGSYQFHLLLDPLPNAFALPGGHVLVSTGLMELTDRPEELAGTVAHEMAHVTERHGFRKIISAAGPYLLFRLFFRDNSGLLGVVGDSSQILVRQGFSQQFELEADAVGWDYLVRARIDPRGLTAMLRKLEAAQDRMKLPRPVMGAFSSHPSTAKRIQRLESKWEKIKDKPSYGVRP